MRNWRNGPLVWVFAILNGLNANVSFWDGCGEVRLMLFLIGTQRLTGHLECGKKFWDGFGTGPKRKITNVYRPWDGWDG